MKVLQWITSIKILLLSIFIGAAFFAPCFFGHIAMAAEGAAQPEIPAEANWVYDDKGNVVTVGPDIGGLLIGLVAKVLYVIFVAVCILLDLAMWLLDTLMNGNLFDSVFFSPSGLSAINIGWKTVRDFVNIFFILIILFIAICTILRISRYSDKDLLAKIVLAALLVNFSKPIALAIIDISQLFMNFFINNLKGQSSFSSQLLQYIKFETFFNLEFNESLSFIVAVIFAIAATFVIAVMLFILAYSLIIRMIAFMVLIILSPVAFAGMALPGSFLAEMKSNWWNKMISYATFGPILLFFLWLSLVVLHELSALQTIPINSSQYQAGATIKMTPDEKIITTDRSTGIIQSLLKVIIPYLVAIYFLYYGYDVASTTANKAGKATGSAFNWGSGKLNKWGRKGAWGLGTVATMGAAPAAYYGGKAIKDEYNAAKEHYKKKIPIVKNMTKEAKEDREARIKARWGGKDKMDEYERGKVAEMRKKWKDQGGIDETTLRNKLKTGNSVEKKAAAVQMAEEGFLKHDATTNENDYTTAMDSIRGDKVLEKKLTEEAEKRNINAVIQHEIQQDMLNNGTPLANAEDAAYQKYLKGVTVKDMKSQDKDLFDNAAFARYMNTHRIAPAGTSPTGGQISNDEFEKQALANLKPEQLAALRMRGVLP